MSSNPEPSEKKTTTVDISELQQKCPAFKEGCPFPKAKQKELIESIEKCPEFQNGCPFKEAKSVSDVYNKLSKIPHKTGNNDEISGQKMVEMFKSMHDTSENLEEKIGDCPVFHKDQGCPFKDVRVDDGKHLVELVEAVTHDQPSEKKTTTVDISELQQKCPAFKEGCPFPKAEQKELIKSIEKCPEFQNGCPFKEAKSVSDVYDKLSKIPHKTGNNDEISGQKMVEMFKSMHDTSENLEEKIGDCPVFHKDQGCPFKDVRVDDGKHLVEPVEAVTHDQQVKHELKKVDAQDLEKQCPAFTDGCPFIKVEDTAMKEALKNCPEFLKGCPFKNVRSLDEVYDMLSKVPHAAGHEEQLSGAKLVEMLKKMHSESQALEEKLGDCPVFHKSEGCPFKSVRSEGKHLVEPVSTVVCA
ncbi:uncharacterized protein LOC124439953 [Xenia sp. Carnegie-2017]|uniref:uncharacterized protein LOC124439953 n=1 Tax=Xenia sp. Carnegie-2017 TaxID=2897299 RepID=UPI001F04E2B2|nr:uncharacterized protein LOC124439953 [Xenia sp. Carnegie-2017]XP_046846217.1 uncharacterized protein LOC124439953 [Xenia sp. Carnegie-2017]